MSAKARQARKSADLNVREPKLEMERDNQTWIVHAIREIKAGRQVEDHFEMIFKTYAPQCRYLLMQFGLGRDVDDLVQDIMMRVFKGLGNFRLQSSFDTWLTQIAKNVAHNAIRGKNTKKVKATKPSLESLAAQEDPDRASPLADPPAAGPGPLDLVLSKEREAELESILEHLPLRVQEAVILFYFHGFKLSEIAQAQGTSVNTVKKQLVEGRKRIRPRLDSFVELFSHFTLLLVLLLSLG